VPLDGAAASPVFMTAKITCAGAADQFVRIGAASATDGGWAPLTGSLTVPSCPLSGLIVYFEGPPAGVNEYIDDTTASFIHARGHRMPRRACAEICTGGSPVA